MTISHSTALVSGNNSLRVAFEINVGLRQIDGLAHLPFKPTLEQVTRKLHVDTKGTPLYKSCQIVIYADDINIFAGSSISSKRNFINHDKANVVDLQINENKTKIMTYCPDFKIGGRGRWIEMIE